MCRWGLPPPPPLRYTQLGLVNPRLKLEAYVQQVVGKLLNPAKVCPEAMAAPPVLHAEAGGTSVAASAARQPILPTSCREEQPAWYPARNARNSLRLPNSALNVPQMCIGASLHESMSANTFVQTLLTQSVAGQLLAIRAAQKDLHMREVRRDTMPSMTVKGFQSLCVAAGMFTNFCAHVASTVGLARTHLMAMEALFVDGAEHAAPFGVGQTC